MANPRTSEVGLGAADEKIFTRNNLVGGTPIILENLQLFFRWGESGATPVQLHSLTIGIAVGQNGGDARKGAGGKRKDEAMKAKKKMRVRLNLRMEPELADYLRRAAKLRPCSISEIVRGILQPAFDARYRKA